MLRRKHKGNKSSFFKRNEEGNAIVEFGLLAPSLFLLLIGIIEISLILFVYSTLEGATGIASRVGKTGFSATANREAYIRSQFEKLTKGLLDPDKLQIKTLAYNSFADIDQGEPCLTKLCAGGVAGIDYIDVNCNKRWDANQGAANAGSAGAVVEYIVTYPWTIFTPLMGQFFGNGSGIYNVTATTAVKNEDFTTVQGCQ